MEFGIWNVLGRGKRKTISEHHIAAIHPSYQVQLFLPTSYLYASHLINNSLIWKKTNLEGSNIGWTMAERPAVDYGPG